MSALLLVLLNVDCECPVCTSFFSPMSMHQTATPGTCVSALNTANYSDSW